MTGIICVNKDKDITSFGVVAKMRGITRERKAGHTGTLDPMARGVLPIMLGGATRFLDFLPNSDKRYTATYILGMTTDTLDITGTVLSKSDVNVSKDEVTSVMKKYIGTVSQLPPMYSAVSVDGKRLYELARQGIEVEREKRDITVKELNLIDFDEEKGIYTIDVLCTKGTYIRTLIDDIGRDLKCGAVMSALERTSAMGFDINNAHTLSSLQDRKDTAEGFDDILIPVEKILSDYDRVSITAPQTIRFKNGGGLDANRIKKELIPDKLYRVYSDEEDFLGLGKMIEDKNELAVARLLIYR